MEVWIGMETSTVVCFVSSSGANSTNCSWSSGATSFGGDPGSSHLRTWILQQQVARWWWDILMYFHIFMQMKSGMITDTFLHHSSLARLFILHSDRLAREATRYVQKGSFSKGHSSENNRHSQSTYTSIYISTYLPTYLSIHLATSHTRMHVPGRLLVK